MKALISQDKKKEFLLDLTLLEKKQTNSKPASK